MGSGLALRLQFDDAIIDELPHVAERVELRHSSIGHQHTESILACPSKPEQLLFGGAAFCEMSIFGVRCGGV